MKVNKNKINQIKLKRSILRNEAQTKTFDIIKIRLQYSSIKFSRKFLFASLHRALAMFFIKS